ncbi:unnamed protein product [Meloidogyne enterolobii]|uniref:Uncharacterized protein n=1 Tax=Meloidogyne enterolobii TaxID=390850 RepID=A0ACB0Z1F5_MELEN
MVVFRLFQVHQHNNINNNTTNHINSFLLAFLQLVFLLSMMTSILLITCSKGKKKKGKDAAIENLKGKKVKSKEAIPPKSEKNSQLGNLNKKDEKKGKGRDQPKSDKDTKQAQKVGGSNEALRTAHMKSGKGSTLGGGKGTKTAQPFATFRGVSTAHRVDKSRASVKAAPSATAIIRKEIAVAGPKYKFVGNIDDEIAQKPSSEFVQGLGPKHAYDRTSQKNKIRKPGTGKVVEVLEKKNILYVSVDASKTKSMTK